MSQSVSDILKINKIKGLLAEYIKVKIELIKLDLTEHISAIIARVIAYLIIMFIGMLAIGFASLAIAHTINEYYASTQLGYWIIAGVYFLFLLGIFLFVRSGKLDRIIEQKITEIAHQSDEQEGVENG